jgi:hypothetical protein
MNLTVGTPVLAFVRLDGITYITGEVAEVTPSHLILIRAAWHRATGRHHEFVAGTSPSTERERYLPDQRVHLLIRETSMVIAPWPGDLDAPSV